MSTEVTVPCPCPGTPHPDGDTVTLKDEPDVPMFVAFNLTWEAVSRETSAIGEWQADIVAALASLYLRHGIASWTFVDEKGEDISVSQKATVRLLPFYKGGKEVAEAADSAFTKILVAPFVEAAERVRKARRPTKKSSHAGPTDASMSPTSPSGSKLRVVSKRSSPVASDGKPSEAQAS